MRPQLSSARALLFRTGAVALGLALALVLAEGGLQLLALGTSGRTLSDTFHGASLRVLCLGDSNTYGVRLPAEDTYPAQLQRALRSRGLSEASVANLGLPGKNSAQVVEDFLAAREAVRPHVVVVCAGINNIWNTTSRERGRTGESRPERLPSRLLRRSRVLRLVRLLLESAREAETSSFPRPEIRRTIEEGDNPRVVHVDASTGEALVAHQGSPGDRVHDVDQARALLRKDLEDLAEACREADISLIALGYAAFSFPPRYPGHFLAEEMSQELEAFAADAGLPFVALEPKFRELLSDGGRRDRFYLTEKDGHPNAVGYGYVAERVAQAILRLAPEAHRPPHRDS